MFHGQFFVSDILPPGGGRASRVVPFLVRHSGTIFFVYVTGLYWLATLAPVRMWTVLPALIALPFVAVGVAQGSCRMSFQTIAFAR
jgi:hypothetical protein